MRLIIVFFTFWLWMSCNTISNNKPDLPATICELITSIHGTYPFHIDSLTQTCGIYKYFSLHFSPSSCFNSANLKLYDKNFECNGLKFKLLEDREEFRNNNFKYFTSIGIEYLSEDGKSVVFLRRTDELFDRPGVAVGLDFSTSENYYMSNINGVWKIDSLVQDIKL